VIIESVEAALPEHMSIAYLPNLGTVRLRLSTRGTDEEVMAQELQFFHDQIKTLIGELIFGYGKQDIAASVGERLLERQQTVVTAESCTGGTIAKLFTGNPGSSGYFQGGVVAYSNQLKQQLLGVPERTLMDHGAVSEQTVMAMAVGARERLGTDYAIATSGVAGPGGGTKEKPVGTIWIAVAGPEGVTARLLRAGKDRQRNITFTAYQALNQLRRVLDGIPVT
jgi:nicotinamide-nucleotide amidase